jgi:heterodisulfide reductase subunit A-like polyferredoxin
MRFSLVVTSCALSGFAVGAHAYVHEKERFTRVRNARDLRSSYDYIVVGGGTSGLTVADRLSEDGKTNVLVIEHGDLGSCSCPRRQTISLLIGSALLSQLILD